MSLILAIVAVVSFTVILYPQQVFSIAFPDVYDLDVTLLSIYIGAGSLLSLNYALTHLHIGAGNLGPWRFMLFMAIGMTVAIFIWHSSVRELAWILTITLSISTVYLVVETTRLIRQKPNH